MGYVYMQEGAEYADYVKFNHCTFLNTIMFTLESGWWHWLSVTNSVFVNAYMFGYIPAIDGATPVGGAVNIDSIGTTNFAFLGPLYRNPDGISSSPITATLSRNGSEITWRPMMR